MPRNPENLNEFIAGPLPTIKANGKEYFVDGRMQEMRNIKDPMDKFDENDEEIGFDSLSKKKQAIIIREYYGVITSS